MECNNNAKMKKEKKYRMAWKGSAGNLLVKCTFLLLLLSCRSPKDIDQKYTNPGDNKAHSRLQLAIQILYEEHDTTQLKNAFNYLKKASEHNSNAAYIIGFELIHGRLFRRDIKRGLRYLRSASSLGNTDAIRTLGEYEFSLGNWTESIKFLEKADSLKDYHASYDLYLIYQHGRLYYSSIAGDVKNMELIDGEKAILYLQRAADAGSVDAQLDLGRYYLLGNTGFISVDIPKAKAYLRMAYNNEDMFNIPGKMDDLEFLIVENVKLGDKTWIEWLME